jgi:hypothetical protein
MNSSSLPRVLLVLAVFLVAVLSGGYGCLPGDRIELTKQTFNPKFSLDRVPVPEEPDPTLGNFRAGPGRSASYVYPAVEEGHRLMQGECYWLAFDSTVSAGDFVKLNWEAVIEFQPDLGNGKRFAPGDNRLTLCRLDHPEERRNPRIIEGTADPLPAVYTMSTTDAAIALNFPDFEVGPWPVRQESDLAVIQGVELTEFQTGTPNPDRLCLSQQLTGSPTNVVKDYKFYQGDSSSESWVQSCSYGGLGIRPDGDASYVVHWGDPTDVGPGRSALWLRPNLMVVDGRELLVRPMSLPTVPEWVWSTPILEPEPHRWGENFSPHLTVQAVRFFTWNGSDPKEYLDSEADLQDNHLCIHRTPDTTPMCNWRCPGEVRDGVLVFDLTKTCRDAMGNPMSCCIDSAGELVPEVAFTPTYDKVELTTNPGGDPILEPLSWSIRPVAYGAFHFIEFDLAAEVSPMAMKMDGLFVDLGSMAQGDTKRSEIRVRNIGGKTVRVDGVGIDPSYGDAGDFDSWILDDPKPVPIPIDLEDQGAEGYELRLGTDFEEFPVVETTEGENFFLGRRVSFDRGAEFTVNGHQVTFQGSQAFYTDPTADFQGPLPKHVDRPFHVLAFRLVQAPFNLLPGESVLVTVSATPSAYGEREARLRVDYSEAADPTNTDSIEAPVLAFGLWGPDASVVPAGVWVSPGSGLPAVRNVFLVNDGDMTLKRTGYTLTGRDAAAFWVASVNPATASIDPAQMEVFQLEFVPDCLAPPPDDYQAELRLTTADQELAVPLLGSSQLCRP